MTAQTITQTTEGPPAPDRKAGPGWRYRVAVAVRALVAIFGGYTVSALWAAALAVMLPAVRVEAALTATMLALVIYPCAVMWCFATRTVARAIGGLIVFGAIPAVVLMIFKGAA